MMIRERFAEVAGEARGRVLRVRKVPGWVLGRLTFLTGVSARAWRNAILSVVAGIVAFVVTLFVLRGIE